MEPDRRVERAFEYTLPDGTQADYVLCDRQGRPMAALEAKRASTDPVTAQDQGRHYAEQLEVPFVFLSNGEEVWFLDRDADAHARKIAGFYSQDDLERRIAARSIRRDLATVETDRRIMDRDYQIECIDALRRNLPRTPRPVGRDGHGNRQNTNGGVIRQAALRSRRGDPRAVAG